MIGELDLERAVVEQLGQSGAADLVHLVEACPGEEGLRRVVVAVEAGLDGAEGDLAAPVGFMVSMAGPTRSQPPDGKAQPTKIRAALEQAGVEFLDRDDGGPGVQLKQAAVTRVVTPERTARIQAAPSFAC